MISPADIAHWQHQAPWATPKQIEQDLVLSRLIIEIANHPYLANELTFRGGTCFHKLWLDRPWRYSEDLDYVRRSAGGVGPSFDALRDVADAVGFDDMNTTVGKHPKVRMRSTFASGDKLQIKVEMNTFERSPAEPIVTKPYAIESSWFTGAANVATFTLEELVATKIRALFQRRKGRDLFDLWLAVDRGGADPKAIAACFDPYRPDRWTAERALENLDNKLQDEIFVRDLEQLAPVRPDNYTTDRAHEVANAIIRLVAPS